MWIKRKRENESEGLPVFTKSFSAREGLVKCELAITATGIFSASINGYEIPDLFMPGWGNYLKRVDVCRYDVTRHINENNVISVTVANGWYSGKLGYGNKTNVFGDEKRLFAELTLTYADGEVEKIVTDEDWTATTSDVVFADFFDGEVIDARLRNKEKRAKNAEISDFSVPLTEYSCEPVRVVETLTPTVIYEDERVIRYDFGRNVAGMISLEASGEPGDKIVVKYGEMLDENGGVYTENLRRARCTDEFILSGGELDCFKPEFTYHGFRYAEISKPASSRVNGIEGRVISQDIEYYGSFECSDEVINGVYAMAKNGQRSNFVSIPTDCPQRDERLGWTGDAQIFVGSAMFNMDCKAFYEKYMCDLRDSQYGNGAVGGVAPHVPHFDYTEEGDRLAAGWADAITVIPYEHYVMYGDKRTLYDNIGAMKAFVRFCRETSEGFIRPEGDNYGDWLNVGSETDKAVLNTLYFAYSASLTARACRIIGDGEEGEFAALYEDICRVFRAKFVDGDGTIKSDTQTAYLLAYAFGAMTKEEISGHLVRKLHEADDHLVTGFLGVKFLLPVLCEIGESELCYKVLTRRSYPGWGYSVVNGATTVWERWNSYTVEHGFGDVRMNSFNHYSLGSCCEWMFRYCLGISPVESAPGFKSVLVRPFVDFSGKITSASGSYECAYGKITVRWESDGDTARYSIEIPDGVTPVYDFSAYKSAENRDGVWILGRK